MDISKHVQAVETFKEIAEMELSEFVKNLSTEELNPAYNLIVKAKKNGNRVHVTGIGKPSYVAGYIASLFSSTGTPAYVLHGTEAIHGSSGQVKEGDIVIAISNSGETEELIKTVTTVKNNGAKVISVSGNRESWLAKQGDAFLFAGVDKEGGPLNKAPRISYLAEIVVLQALSIALQNEENIDLQDYKKWHPGGALGKSIK
jgi:arabinose-5-phosphate isomerase